VAAGAVGRWPGGFAAQRGADRSLANLAKRNLTQLTALVKTRLKRMQYRPGLLDGFLASTGLDLAPLGNPHCGCFSGIAAGRRLRARR
jgi:hypothetical protein